MGNHLGSASLELSDDGSIISYEEYHPYGTTAYHAGTGIVEESPKRYRYTGMERDEETGFILSLGRDIMAVWLGRWTAADPAGTIDGLNRYRYGQNRPNVLVDVSGQQSVEEEIKVEEDLLEGATMPKPISIRAELDPLLSGETWSQGVKVRKGDVEVNLKVQPPRIPRSRSRAWDPTRMGNIESGEMEEYVRRENEWHRELGRFFNEVLYRNSGTPIGSTTTFLREYINEREILLWQAEMAAGPMSGEREEISPMRGALTIEKAYLEYRIGGGSVSFIEWFSQRASRPTGDSGHQLDVVLVHEGRPVLAWLGVTSGAKGTVSITTYTDQLWVHTEAIWTRLNWAFLENLAEPEEYEVYMVGEREACHGCAPTLEEVAAWTGVTFRYINRGPNGDLIEKIFSGNVTNSGSAAINNLRVNPPSYYRPSPAIRNP